MIRNGICLGEDELKLILGVNWEKKLKNVRKDMERKEHLLLTLKQGDIIFQQNNELTVLDINYNEGLIKCSGNKRFDQTSKHKIKFYEYDPIVIRTQKEYFFNRNIYKFDKPPIIRLKDEDINNTLTFLESIYGDIKVTKFHETTRIHWNICLESNELSNELSKDDIKQITLWLGKTIEEIKVIRLPKINGQERIIQHIVFNTEKSKI